VSAADDGPAGPPSRDRLLIDLGQELRAMRGELQDATSKFDVVVADVSEVIGPDVATLRADVAELRGIVDGLLAQPDDETEAPLLHWPDLTVDEADEAWKELGKFVANTLGYWYEITRRQLPDCWPLHRPALLQVWWLRLTYVAAHEGTTAGPVPMAEWNTRWIDGALAKISDAIPDTLCRPVTGGPGQHLVPAHQAQQQASQPQAAQGNPPAATPASPYAVPAHLQPGPRPSATTTPQPSSATSSTAAADEVTGPQYWEGFFHRARAEDLQRRHQRAAAAAAAESPAP
jgi:hypothetical protein